MSDILPFAGRFIVGLGNPGTQYSGTRHNIGFQVLDKFLEGETGGTGWKSFSGAETAEIRMQDFKLHLVKPMTFMNRSGQPLSQVLKFYNGAIDSLLVVHDEVDLPLGSVRIKIGGGEGGHNGLRSISGELGTKEYARLRIGVGRPPHEKWDLSDWVLTRFGADESQGVHTAVEKGCEAIRGILTNGIIATQNMFNRI